MQHFNRRHFLAGSAAVAGAAFLAACSNDGESDGADGDTAEPLPSDPSKALSPTGTAGLMDEATYQKRVDEYLSFATESFSAASATSIAVHLIAAGRDPDYTWPIEEVTVESLSDSFEKIDTWEDTRDFTLMYFHWMLELGRGDTPMTTLDPAVLDAIETRMLENRYRYDDPYPEDRIDSQWYWSENHILILAVDEYLAGQRFPDETFAVTGLTGTEAMVRTKPVILEWIDERARFGFFEWHSHVYMLKNIAPLLLLSELAQDPELVRAAGMGLDLCLMDMAVHTQAGAFTASRGRTYKKDKMSSLDEGTFGTAKFIFDDTTFDYQSTSDTGTSYFCAATRYRPPQVAIDAATAPSPGVVRERHGIFVDGSVPVTNNPEAPFGYDFADPANLSFWWSQGAVGLWQIADISLSEAEEHRLFETPLLEQVKQLSDLNGGDPERIKPWEQANHAIINFGHLREANTYGWRGESVSLASVVDHRFGEQRDQAHSWQAAVDAEALVFTNHPVTELEPSSEWRDDGRPGYWTGEASMPRSAQHEKTGIHIYQPAYDETTDELLWSVFEYRDYTHAYVPQDRFDEVTQDGNWTFARKGDGFIALWSWRDPTWRTYDPALYATDGMAKPFDLVAEGGANNVWIVEVGDPSDGSFQDWTASISNAEPQVSEVDAGFEVEWESPAAGTVTFGSVTPFTVAGEEVSLADYPRHESAFGSVPRLEKTYAWSTENATLKLDFDSATRTVASA